MKLIAGLGNPGKKYERTRHNAGFEVIDILAARWNIAVNREKFKALAGEGVVNGEKVLLLKPQTFMNLSGESVQAAVSFYGDRIDEILVIHDELDIPVGKIKLKKNGGTGGHNGLKSISRMLGGDEYRRLRVGISRPEGMIPVVSYVLGKFDGDNRKLAEEAFAAAADAVELWAAEGIDSAMNQYN